MDDVASWLTGLGLGQYVQRFADNDADFSVICDLTELDFKDLGVSLGHRRKLLRAIADLRIASRPGSCAPSIGAEPRADEGAERRQLTVMFCDLVGSTALTARLDLEDMHEVVCAFQDACASIVCAYDGFLARFMGDAVLVYFGYPRAHGDDAERAVRAGLDLVATIERLELPGNVSLQARVGIATGPVVVGDLVNEGASQTRSVVGETPNIAARLEALAEPGTVVIAASTRLLIGNLFDLHDLGPHQLKGYSEPAAVWAVQGPASFETRFEAMRSLSPAGFVGREQQLAVLLDRKQMAWDGAGQVVLLSGEPGIGKSRLVAELVERLAREPHTLLQYQCSSYHSSSALYPFIQQLKFAAKLRPHDTPQQQLDKLEAIIAVPTQQGVATAPLLAALLSIPDEGRYPPISLSAGQQRRQTLSALLDQVEGLAQRQPVVILIEDIHWSDATSLELLDLSCDRIRHLPVFIIVTSRPGFALSRSGLSNVVTIKLDRLDAKQVREMVCWLAGECVLAAEVMDQVVAKTDGIPLFVEELTKAVLESGLLTKGANGHLLEGGRPASVIPATLQDSLMARLDRVDAVRLVAQIGSAIGRSFSYGMLAAVMGGAQPSLPATLERLVDAELMFQRGTPPDATYTFKHALVQDAAYESLLRGRRRDLHARIVQTIETRFTELIETECEILAQHCARAGLTEKAAAYWLQAGRRSLQRSNLAEAAAHLQAAIGQLLAQPDSIERRRQELSCQTALAHALIGARGYGAPETMAAWFRAQALAAEVGNVEQRFAVNYGLWVGQYAQAHLGATLSLAEEGLRAAQAEGDRTQLCIAHRMNGIACFIIGDFSRARDHCIEAVGLYDAALHPQLANQLGHDLLVAALCFKALALGALGYPVQARKDILSALAQAKQLEHAPSLAYTHWHGGVLGGLTLRDDSLVEEHADALLVLATKHGLTPWEFPAHAVQGWMNARRHGDRLAVDQIVSSLEIRRVTRALVNDTVFFGLLGDAQSAVGDASAGLASVHEGLLLAESSRLQFWLAELYRLDGAVRLRLLPADEAGAEAALRNAISIARRQGALTWELRAALDLAALLMQQNRNAQAETILSTAYRAFTEGHDTPDLQAARTLLTKLDERTRRIVGTVCSYPVQAANL